MTLVWLGLFLAFLVTVFTFLIWDNTNTFRRHQRALTLMWERQAREDEDRCWAEFLAETRLREQALTDTLVADGAVDRLVALIGRVETLDVVA